MPLQTCPNGKCKANLHVPERLIGKKVKCPKCSCQFPVKQPPAPPRLDPPPVEKLDDSGLLNETRVFISHSVGDKEIVGTAILQFLRDHNVATWICTDDISGGANFEQKIVEGLNKSDWFVVVLSSRSINSKPVRQEIDLALETKERGRILPVLIEQLTPEQLSLLHPELPSIQYEDFSRDVNRAQRRLLISMVRQLNHERNELEKKVERLSDSIEEQKTEKASLTIRLHEMEGIARRAAGFDGNWIDDGASGTVPVFCPLNTRGIPIIAVCNLKGGVGKTTLTANLGATLWGDQFRKRVLLVDLDYQGSLSTICLDGKVRSKLTQQKRFVQEIFRHKQPDGNLVIQLAHEVKDEKTKNHEGFIIAANEDLAAAEGEVLGRWLMKEDGIDGRYLLRQALHTNAVQKNFDVVLLDCPPRLTAAGVNGFLAADYLLVPTPLEEVSTEAVPRLLQWVRELRRNILTNLDVLGVVISRTREGARLQEQEKEILVRLMDDCQAEWGDRRIVFNTFIPTFPAVANSYQYPARHSGMRAIYSELIKEIVKRAPMFNSPSKAPQKAAAIPVGRK